MNVHIRKLKQTLTSDQIILLLKSLDSDVYKQNKNEIIFYSCCHHLDSIRHKPKLYYYIDTCSFFCYSCSSAFDIISLIKQRWNLLHKKFTFMDIIEYIISITGIEIDNIRRLNTKKTKRQNTPWQSILNKYEVHQNSVDLINPLDKKILNFFSNIYPLSWLEEGISIEAMKQHNIKYYRLRNQTVIPCYDADNNLIGMRVRNWNKDCDRKYDSLKTIAIFNSQKQKNDDRYGTDFKFPTNGVLYGFNLNRYNIEKHKKVIITESEKSVLKSYTWYGRNSIAVGLFGGILSNAKRDLILDCGVDEVIIVPDYDYKTTTSTKYKTWWNKQLRLAKKFQGFSKVTIVPNYGQYVQYKDNAFDITKERFELLVSQRQDIFQLNKNGGIL